LVVEFRFRQVKPESSRRNIMNETLKKCPMCAEEIKLEAVICKYCGAQFEVTHNGYCQNCHQIREASENGQCKVCNNPVMDLHVQSRHIEKQPSTSISNGKIPEVIAPKPKSSTSRKVYTGILIVALLTLLGLCLLPFAQGLKLSLSGNPPAPQPTNTVIAALPLSPTSVPATAIVSVDGFKTSTQTAIVPAGDPNTATGRILWNGQPMAGVTVTLCTDWGMFGGCDSQEYSAVSGSDGSYTISGLPPGEYDFVTKIPGQDNETGWLGFNITLVDGQSVTIRDANVIKYDLKILSPNDNQTVTSNTPTLTWEAYPGAAYYKVYVAEAVMFEQVTAAQYTFSTPLAPDKYYWSIDAYNSNGIEIAESSGQYFVVAP
jgi:hypothetical protein